MCQLILNLIKFNLNFFKTKIKRYKLQVISDLKLAPIIGSAVNQILDFMTHACQKKRASGSRNRSKTSCDRSEVKIYLLNFSVKYKN